MGRIFGDKHGHQISIKNFRQRLRLSGWCGPDDGTSGSCNSSTYFTNPSGGETVDDIFRDGSNDRWIQYKAFLTSDGGFTPTISSTTLTYVVNAPPNFDATYGTNGVTVSQSSGDTDYDSDGASDIGEVLLIYSVRDTDTNSGTVNPGQITPSFEYRLNSGASWTSITSGYLNTGALSLKNVSQDSYTSTSTTVNASTTSALWNAVSQLGTNTFQPPLKSKLQSMITKRLIISLRQLPRFSLWTLRRRRPRLLRLILRQGQQAVIS